MFFFFFSSRRRHTRSTRDWSSDVCSSDLADFLASHVAERRGGELSRVLSSANGLAGSRGGYAIGSAGRFEGGDMRTRTSTMIVGGVLAGLLAGCGGGG